MQPEAASSAPPPRSRLAGASLLLGILGNLGLGPITGIPAILTGHLALGRARRDPVPYGGKGLAIAGLILGYASLVIGLIVFALLLSLALPKIVRTGSQPEATACLGRLKSLGLAARIYAQDHDDRYPATVADLGPYLGTLGTYFVCPADPARQPFSGTNWVELTDRHVSYEFRTPGARESDVGAGDVVFRCPIHGSAALGDGSVRLGHGPDSRPESQP